MTKKIGEPTPQNPEIYDRAIVKTSGQDAFIIPKKWKSRNNQMLGGNFREVEVRDCGVFMILKPKKPRKKHSASGEWEE
jgi:hypothetical protein